MHCLLCHKKISRLRLWRTGSEFCCEEHAETYKKQMLDRLMVDSVEAKPAKPPLEESPGDIQEAKQETPVEAPPAAVPEIAETFEAAVPLPAAEVQEAQTGELPETDAFSGLGSGLFSDPSPRPEVRPGSFEDPRQQTAEEALAALRQIAEEAKHSKSTSAPSQPSSVSDESEIETTPRTEEPLAAEAPAQDADDVLNELRQLAEKGSLEANQEESAADEDPDAADLWNRSLALDRLLDETDSTQPDADLAREAAEDSAPPESVSEPDVESTRDQVAADSLEGDASSVARSGSESDKISLFERLTESDDARALGDVLALDTGSEQEPSLEERSLPIEEGSIAESGFEEQPLAELGHLAEATSDSGNAAEQEQVASGSEEVAGSAAREESDDSVAASQQQELSEPVTEDAAAEEGQSPSSPKFVGDNVLSFPSKSRRKKRRGKKKAAQQEQAAVSAEADVVTPDPELEQPSAPVEPQERTAAASAPPAPAASDTLRELFALEPVAKDWTLEVTEGGLLELLEQEQSARLSLRRLSGEIDAASSPGFPQTPQPFASSGYSPDLTAFRGTDKTWGVSAIAVLQPNSDISEFQPDCLHPELLLQQSDGGDPGSTIRAVEAFMGAPSNRRLEGQEIDFAREPCEIAEPQGGIEVPGGYLLSQETLAPSDSGTWMSWEPINALPSTRDLSGQPMEAPDGSSVEDPVRSSDQADSEPQTPDYLLAGSDEWQPSDASGLQTDELVGPGVSTHGTGAAELSDAWVAREDDPHPETFSRPDLEPHQPDSLLTASDEIDPTRGSDLRADELISAEPSSWGSPSGTFPPAGADGGEAASRESTGLYAPVFETNRPLDRDLSDYV